MIPAEVAGAAEPVRAPRVCGDDPTITYDGYRASECSPRMRG